MKIPFTTLRSFFAKDTAKLSLIGVFYAVGVAGHLFHSTQELMLYLTPGFLGLFGVFAAFPSWKAGGLKFLTWLIPAYLLTFTLEALGVATGAVFGAYHYGKVLGPMIFEVPVVIGFNWVLVVLGAIQWTRRLLPEKLPGRLGFEVILASLVCVGFDWIMEPLAMGLGYWIWDGGIIPLQNYLAWALIAGVTTLLYQVINPKDRGILAGGTMLIQAGFFLALRLGGLGV